jgi:hypothetical protein
MRRLFVLGCFGCVLVCGAACKNEDPAALFLDFDYQVRCVDCVPRSNDDPAREIHAVDGEDDLTIDCSTIEREGDRLVSFSLEHFDTKLGEVDFSLSVEQIDLDSGDPGAGCQVVAKEGSNVYEGDCTDGDPNDDQPCSIELEQEGDGIRGTLHCVHIENKAQPTLRRHITAPGVDEPAEFEVTGCGL